jgi:hypothetical protein
MIIDITKLEKVKASSNGWTARCPYCASQNGGDKTGNHLSIMKDGRFNCIVGSDDPNHNKGILSLVGANSDGNYTIEHVEEKVEIERVYDLEVLDRLVKDHSYWGTRGISEATVAPFRGGVGTEGQLKNRYIFPIFNRDGDKIIGFTGRKLDQKMQISWKHIGSKSKFLWGNLQEIEDTQTAVIVESIGDALALNEYGVKNVIVIFGVTISSSVIGFLISCGCNKIYVSTNNDQKHTVGQSAAIKIKEKLDMVFNEGIVEIFLPAAKDFGECSVEQIEEFKKEINYGN